MSYQLKGVVKQADESGSFTAVASMPTLDRDGEVVAKGAFSWAPEGVPVHAFHNFADPVGWAPTLRYEGDALIAEGTFGTTPRAREIRQLVLDGAIRHVSVGFMRPETEMRDGVRTIVRSELLEVSLVSVPSNRQAAVLAAKSPTGRFGAGQAHLAALQMQLELLQMDLDALEAAKGKRFDPVDVKGALRDAKNLLADLRKER